MLPHRSAFLSFLAFLHQHLKLHYSISVVNTIFLSTPFLNVFVPVVGTSHCLINTLTTIAYSFASLRTDFFCLFCVSFLFFVDLAAAARAGDLAACYRSLSSGHRVDHRFEVGRNAVEVTQSNP